MAARRPPKPPEDASLSKGDKRALAVCLEQMIAQLGVVVESCATKDDIRELKAGLANCATKADLANCATKADLANCATKADLANCATKADIRELKADIHGIKGDIHGMNVRFDSVDAQLRSLREEVARKADAAALAALDQRVTILERRAG